MEKLKQLKTQIENSHGQAALVMVLVVMSVLLIVIASLGLLTYNDLKSIGNTVDSSQSYYVSEAGIEDALYRIVNAKAYTNSYNLSVGNGSTAVNVSGPITSLVITSNGNVNSRFRKLEVAMGTSDTASNVAFNYGVQVGYGGLQMDNNSVINGNVYSNGPVVGCNNGCTVTGTAIAATGAGTIDQDNSSPATPSNSITFGNANSAQDAEQSFQVSADNQVKSVDLYIKKVSTPGDLTVNITNDNSGSPGSTVYATGTLSASSVTTNYGWVTVTFTTNPQLNAGATYWLVLDGGTSASKYYIWGANNAYINGAAYTGQYSGGPYTAQNLDGYFKLSLGGVQNGIDSLDIIGADARAHSITNSHVSANKYCQTTDNSPACNTSQPDPSPQAFPISDANIVAYEAEAQVGGTTSGDVTITTNQSLGPREITGNLTVNGGVTLTVTGTLYVHGYISFGNGSTITLDPGYGTTGGTIVADGYVFIDNLVTFNGSGQTGSYVMLISNNDCNGTNSPTGMSCTTNNSAMYVSNNAGTVILFTPNGQMRFKNNAGAKEATAFRLYLEENATITYQTGLANANFTSGPGAGYQIESWKEIE